MEDGWNNTDSYPLDSKEVLTWSKYMGYCLDAYNAKFGAFRSELDQDGQSILYWRELPPPPPKEDRDYVKRMFEPIVKKEDIDMLDYKTDQHEKRIDAQCKHLLKIESRLNVVTYNVNRLNNQTNYTDNLELRFESWMEMVESALDIRELKQCAKTEDIAGYKFFWNVGNRKLMIKIPNIRGDL